MKLFLQLEQLSLTLRSKGILGETNGLRWWETQYSNWLFSTDGTRMIRTQVGDPDSSVPTYWLITREAVGNKLLQQNVSNAALQVRASKAQLQKAICLNPCHKGKAPQETMASTVEALVGAVWFDCGGNIDVVRGVMESLGIFSHE